MTNLIIASTSTLPGTEFLEYLMDEIAMLFAGVDEIIFIPFARPGGISHDDYTAKARTAFRNININIRGLHEFQDPEAAIKSAKGIFTGGGNTFLLVTKLYDHRIMSLLKEVLESGVPYLGCSAGSNIAGMNMQTTNDMPIIYPPSFETLQLMPFNLNPHYLDPDHQSKHMGETRETRIKEFHEFNDIPVVGLREGSWIRVEGKKCILQGRHTARLFRSKHQPVEVQTGADLSELHHF